MSNGVKHSDPLLLNVEPGRYLNKTSVLGEGGNSNSPPTCGRAMHLHRLPPVVVFVIGGLSVWSSPVDAQTVATSTSTPTVTLTATATLLPTVTTPTPTATGTTTPTPTAAPTGTATPPPTAATGTLTATMTGTPTPTPTAIPTLTLTPTGTPTPTATATASTPTPMLTATPTATATPKPTLTVTPTPTATTPLATPTGTATSTAAAAQTTEGRPGYEQIPALGRKLSPARYQNLDYTLNETVRKTGAGSVPRGSDGAQSRAVRGESVAVAITVDAGYAQDVLTFLQNNGALAEAAGDGDATLLAYVPVTLLPRLAQQPGVVFVRTEDPGEPAGGPGATAHRANYWSAAGFEGQGVKIGIMDFGFAGYHSFRFGTVLPEPAGVLCYHGFSIPYRTLRECERASGTNDHGTIVTEMAYDVAPQATYYLARVDSAYLQFRAAVDWFIEQDVDVINFSGTVGWDGPGDGTSPSAYSPLRAIDKAVQNGIIVTLAAGNYGSTSWFGTFNDPDDDDVLDFVDSDECNFMHGTNSGPGARVEVRWEDDWSGPNTDLDIYVRKVSDGTIMAKSEDTQSGQSHQEPTEFISYTAPNGTGDLCLSIEHRSGEAPDWVQMIDIRSLGLERRTFSHAIRNPAETVSAGALSVGMAPHDDTDTIRAKSSRGPLPNGTVKPDIVGAVGVRSEIDRDEAWGTSFAAPHLAGLAALVKQRYPTYSPSQIAQYLKDHADARDGPDEGDDPDSPNNYWGYGFAQLPADFMLSGLAVSPVDITGFDSTVSTYHVDVTNSVTQVSITPTASDTDSTITIGTTTVASGAAHTVSLTAGRNVITITVTASDNTATMTYRVIVDRGYNSPWFSETVTTREVAENTATETNVGDPVTATDADGDTLTYALGGTDAGSFTIVSTSGQLRTKTGVTYDHETQSSYAVTVSVHNGKDANGMPDTTIDDTIAVAITVSNVDEPGTVSLSAEQPRVGTELTATLTDPDGSVTGVTWEWESSVSKTYWVTISAATTDRYTPASSYLNLYLRVRASYTDGHGADKQVQKTLDYVIQAESTTATATATATPTAISTSTPRSTASPTVTPTITPTPTTTPTAPPTSTTTPTAPPAATAPAPATATATPMGPVIVPPPPGGDGGSSSGGGSSGGGGAAVPAAALPVPTHSPLIGSTTAATAMEVAGDRLVLERHDQAGVEIKIAIGWISRDGETINVSGFVRDGDLGQTYAVVRREGDGQVVRRWIAPDSPLVAAVPWAVVNTKYTFPVGVILAIPLDEQYPWPHMLMRRFDGGDDRILAYDAELGQWRHVPDAATFQALGFYWCNVTAADAGFFARIELGPAYPASSMPARSDYPVCQS